MEVNFCMAAVFFARWPPYLSSKGAELTEKIGGPCFVIARFFSLAVWPLQGFYFEIY